MDSHHIAAMIREAHERLEQVKVGDLGRDEALHPLMLAHQHRGDLLMMLAKSDRDRSRQIVGKPHHRKIHRRLRES